MPDPYDLCGELVVRREGGLSVWIFMSCFVAGVILGSLIFGR